MEKFTMDSVDLSKLGEEAQAQPEKAKTAALLQFVGNVLESDQALTGKLANTATLEERYNLFKDYLDVSMEDFKKAHDVIIKKMDSAMYIDEATGKLTDEALDMVAGGSKSDFEMIEDCITKEIISWFD